MTNNIRVAVAGFVFLLLVAVAPCPALAAQPPDTGSEIYSDAKMGRVGIGTTEPLTTLDVSRGEVKVGSTGAPCTATLAGAIRFADDQLQVCNSHGWRPITVGTPPQ